MASLDHRLRLIRGFSPREAAFSLAVALQNAEPLEQVPIALALLSTGDPHDPNAPAAILENLHLLDDLDPAEIRRSGLSFGPAIERAARSDDRQRQINALAILQVRARTDDPRALGALLDSPLEGVADRAAATLLELSIARRGINGRGRPKTREHFPGDLEQLALTALKAPAHRQRETVLIAAALLAVRPGPAMAAILADSDHPSMYSLRAAAGHIEHPLVQRNAINWLRIAPLSSVLTRQLHRLESLEAVSRLLAGGYLLLAPERRRAMRRVDRAARCVPGLDIAIQLAAAEQIQLLRFLRDLPLSHAHRRQRLAQLIALPDPTARLFAVLSLRDTEISASGATDTLGRFALDRDPSVARQAFRGVAAAGVNGNESLWRRLEQGAHQAIVDRATRILAAHSIEAFFQRWLRLDELTRVALAHRLAAQNKRGFAVALERAVTTGRRAEKLAAIRLAARLRIATQLHTALIAQAASSDAHIASATVAVLGASGTAPARDAARVALRHADSRVRANAIEALMRIDECAIDVVAPFARTRENRLRANAIRALVRVRPSQGLQQLQEMLEDVDPLHRVSGVWVARQTCAAGVEDDLRAMADRDDIPEVRARAATTVRWLERHTLAADGACT